MTPCERETPHERRRLVLTGGLGGGKTAAFELIRQHFCIHVRMLNEAAGIVLGRVSTRGRTRAAACGPASDFLCPARTGDVRRLQQPGYCSLRPWNG